MGEDDIEHIEAAGIKIDGIPQWAGCLIIVALFLGYLVKQDGRDDMVAEQRITRCHDIQTESNAAMRELTQALILHREACAAMTSYNAEVLRRLDSIDRKLGVE